MDGDSRLVMNEKTGKTELHISDSSLAQPYVVILPNSSPLTAPAQEAVKAGEVRSRSHKVEPFMSPEPNRIHVGDTRGGLHLVWNVNEHGHMAIPAGPRELGRRIW